MTETSSTLAWILFFYVYCFLGWCVESCYVSYFQKKWVNRGFMRGPYIPLYGTGALMVTYVTLPTKHSVILTFFAGAFSASVLEYVTGVLMEAIFKVRYWDYSDHKYNINGHVCLLNTVEWGFLTLFLVFVLDKPVAKLVNGLTEPVQLGLAVLISLIFWTDFILSVKAAFDVRDMIVKMEEAKEEITRLQRRLDVLIAVADDSIENWKEEHLDMMEGKLEILEEKLAINYEEREAKRREKKAERRAELQNISDRFHALVEENWERKEEKIKFMEEFKEELDGFREKHALARKREERLSRPYDFWKSNLLLNSPTATSRKFKESFEEVLEHAKGKKKDKKRG
ncbi:MAG: hypothetical protein MR380_06540 [Lachnospiraceae bacterium]|nr:hypothetical protein [Lachnospiraceae bacterium]